ncbi:MAG: adenylylsulfate kinase [Myxococcota bacterium]|jgi:adenylylsulfate kinase
MGKPVSDNITWHDGHVTAEQRRAILGQRGAVLWFTGLSGSGKSTVARRVEQLLLLAGNQTYVLDGDNLRMGLNQDLGFSAADRSENIRRVGCVAQLFADAGVLCLSAFISPYRADRQAARDRVPQGQFLEVFIDTPLEVCEARDPKGLYKKARAGEIPTFTGISAPYESPENPEIHVETADRSVESCAQEVVDYLESHSFLSGFPG